MSVGRSTLHCMTETLDRSTVLRLRMRALGLGGESAVDRRADADPAPAATAPERIAETAQRMLAVQGQDWRSARWALGIRTPESSVADVHEAFNRGLIVRSWPMRGTIHLLTASDIGWMQRTTNRRVLAGAAKRREFLGITDAMLDRLVETSIAALRGSNGMDREQLSAVWTEAGVEWKSNWRYHLIWWLCQNGIAVLGPVSERGEPRLVLVSEWIVGPRDLDGDDALRELASRYATARGAVTAQDLAWWSGLTASESKRGLAQAVASGQLVECGTIRDEKPITLWVDPRLLNEAPRCDGEEWLLLPAFDEHLLGYQDRSVQLDVAHFERIVPGRNGMFLATVVRNGRVVGTWKKGTRRGEGLLATPLPGEALSDGSEDLQREADRWATFHGLGEMPFGSVATTA